MSVWGIGTRVVMSVMCLVLITHQALAGADYAREQRWAAEFIPGIIVGEPVYLTQKNGHRFVGILSEADNARMGVIVVHGMGLHPDWGMIGTLRQDLFDFGYTTLSIQMPVLAADASYTAYPQLFPEAVERLQLAANFLKQKAYKAIAIVSHSNGSRMSRVYMITNPVEVNAWVALSLTQGDTFDGVSVPVLDLYGETDLPHVLESVEKREASLRANAASKQIRIPGADHFFYQHESLMIETVKQFLDGIR